MRSRLVLTGLLMLVALPLSAQPTPIPELGDHRFVPVTAIDEPFITSYVQNSVGVGRSLDSTTRLIDVNDSTVVSIVDADQRLAALNFEYQNAAKDWLAVRLAFALAGRFGASTNTVVSNGVIGAVGYDLGWKLRMHQSRSTLLSGSVNLGNNSVTYLSIRDWARGIIEDTDVSLVRDLTSLNGTGALHGAWGIDRRFGLLGSAKLIYGESFDGQGKNEWSYDFRAAVSYDARSDLRVPIGFALAGGHYGGPGASVDAESGIWFWSLRTAAQGRRDFSIGLDLQVSYFDSVSHMTGVQIGQINIDMRYFH